MWPLPRNLAGDYADLFLSGKNAHLAPSESAYLEKMIYGQATVDVIEAYAELGFIRDDSFREPHDHIALECAFMAALAVELLEHARGGDRVELKRLVDAQASFIDLHMGRWIPGWAGELTAAAGTAFYKAVAELASSFIVADGDLCMSSAKMGILTEILEKSFGPRTSWGISVNLPAPHGCFLFEAMQFSGLPFPCR